MQHQERPLSGAHHSVFIVGILVGAISLGSLAAVLVVSGDARWARDEYTPPAQSEADRQTAVPRAQVADVAVRPVSCQARQRMCAAGAPRAPREQLRPREDEMSTETRPGERESFLFGSAAAARKRVWGQEQVTTDPATQFQMNGVTSPRP
jgi:hypothetical protein